MGGYVGKLFQEFAITVSVSLVLSLVISLTLTPMMCARLLKTENGKRHGWLYRLSERGFDGLLALYERGLKVALRHRFITLTGDVRDDRAHRLPLRRDSQGLLPAAGHRDDRRHRRSGAGHLLPGHGPAHGGRDGHRAEGPGGRAVGAQIGAGGATVTLNQGRVFIALEAARPARRQRRSGHRAAAGPSSPESRASPSTCRRRRTSPSARGCRRRSISTR